MGLETFYHDNGQKEAKGTFKGGKQDGLETQWYSNGQKKYEWTYKDGKLISGKKWDSEGNLW
jgi:antitoxin component YwqK of YwqJK toxin-antitoxin module